MKEHREKKSTAVKAKKPKRLSSKTPEARKLLTPTDPLDRLSSDLKEAAKLMAIEEARYLVKSYYNSQKKRIRDGHLVDRCEEAQVPTNILRWAHGNFALIESDIQKSLGIFAAEYSVGQWLQGICGIAGVLSAGLLTTFDVRERLRRHCTCADKKQDKQHGKGFRMMKPIGGNLKDETLRFRCTGRRGKGEKDDDDGHVTRDKSCKVEVEVNVSKLTADDGILVRPKTAGAFFRYAGVEPAVTWKKGELRPWNVFAKTLATFKLGECFVKVQNRDNDIYGHLFAQRKEYEEEQNRAGMYKEQALAKAAEWEEKEIGLNTIAYKYYKNGILPSAHIHSRARRWAIKLFLSHLHHVMYKDYYGEAPPVPFVFSKAYDGPETHTHYIPPPEIETNGLSLRHLYGEI